MQSATSSAALRRRVLCEQLGIGDCNGKQLLRVLNRFSFGRSEVVAALAVVGRDAAEHAATGSLSL